uniref:Serine 3-dehydrogenase n=1 Tax=uncultured bacterium A1Q1_fos_517 TaxID=1256582 RepID=L7VZI3_9BACT|nr:serine 3-dehydrogenase [uncultured bacterium A1Q1_fos_517]
MSTETGKRIAVVTGASSGFGAASARALAGAGFSVVLGARRVDRLAAVAEPIGARFHELDVTDDASVEAFCATLERVDVLVNNAGNAFGAESLAASVDDKWRAMFELNVLGMLRMTRTLLPRLVASGDGLVVNLGSIAGIEAYPGGGGYAASKFAVHALTKTLRLELLGQPVRVTEILPGLAETEFALVRFEGDRERARKVYEGMTPLRAEDIAEAVRWVATLPSHVDIDEIVIRPRDQASTMLVHRRPTE